MTGALLYVFLARDESIDEIDPDVETNLESSRPFAGGVVVASVEDVPYYDCPDGALMGMTGPGEAIRVMGHDGTGEWYQIQGPWPRAETFDTDPLWGPTDQLWIRAEHVEVSGASDLSWLSTRVVECQPDGIDWSRNPYRTTVPADSTTTTTTAGGVTTTTTAGGVTTTTVAVTTTTTVGLPSVGAVAASRDPIWEGYESDEALGTCTAIQGQFIKSEISAVVTAPAGVQSVVMEWSVGAVSGSKSMALSGGSYRAILGRFDAENPNVVPTNGSLPITVTVRATDSLGRVATAQRTVTLNDCTLG